MSIRTLYLPALIVAGVLLACAAALLALSEKKAQAAFPGKNGRIAYVYYGGYNSGIYTSNPNGSGKTKVTRGEQENPSYSPDGKRIAYSSTDGHDQEIYTINVGGGGKFQVTHNHRNDYDPDYSPNGKRIAYTSYGESDSEIYTSNVGGASKFKVTNNTKDDEEPSYSPDGKKIAYTGYKEFDSSDDEDFDSEIYMINIGGGGKSQVTNTKFHSSEPSWGSRQ